MTVQYMLWSRVKGAGEEHRVKVYILRAGLARRLVVMVTDVGIVPFLYCLRQSLFNAVVLGIYSNILLGLGPLRKQFLATYIKDLFLGKMLRSNKSRKWMNHGKPVCHPDDVIYVIENWFVLKTNSRTCRFSVLKKKRCELILPASHMQRMWSWPFFHFRSSRGTNVDKYEFKWFVFNFPRLNSWFE